MQTVIQSTSEKPSDTLFVHIFYGNEPSVYTYYEDDGETYSYEKGSFLESEMSFNPTTKNIVLQSLTAKSYSSKFKTISVILHGFDAISGQLKLNGKGISLKETYIDLFNSIKPTDPLWFESRIMEQKVLKIEGINAGKGIEISW